MADPREKAKTEAFKEIERIHDNILTEVKAGGLAPLTAGNGVIRGMMTGFGHMFVWLAKQQVRIAVLESRLEKELPAGMLDQMLEEFSKQNARIAELEAQLKKERNDG